jgi:hypothetical protein
MNQTQRDPVFANAVQDPVIVIGSDPTESQPRSRNGKPAIN